MILFARRLRSVALLAVGAASLLGGSRAGAQDAPPPPPSTPVARTKKTVAPPRPPYNTLKDALEGLQWDANARGPLVVLDPQNVQPWTPARNPYEYNEEWRPPTPLLPKETGSYQASEVAAHFGRKVVRLGSCAVMAPTEMVVLNANPGPPDPYAGMRRDQKLAMLQATLTPAQWQAMASPQGLGLGQMDKDQAPLFLSFLPDPLKVRKATVSSTGGYQFEGTSKDNTVTLAGAQRAGVRLRLNRQMQLTVTGTMGAQASRINLSVSGGKSGGSTLLLIADREWGRPDAFGVRVIDTVPNKLKASQINFDAPGLATLVSVKDAKTVGDLIQRIAQASGGELYADARIAKLPVWVRVGEGENATNVRAGELLKGLCWCVTGAVRRVEASRTSRALPTGGGVAFVLTDDIEGIGARKARLAEWYQNGQGKTQRITEELNARIRKQSPIQYVRFGENDALAPSRELQDKIETSWKKGRTRYEGVKVATRDLPPAQQAQVRETANQYASQEGNERQNIKVDGERVSATIQGKLTLVIPGMGEAEDQSAGYNALQAMLPPPDYSDYINPNFPKPTTDPIALSPQAASGSVLYVAPRTEEEALLAVATAKRRGVQNVWLPAPDGASDTAGTALVAAAVDAGKSAGVRVWPVVRALTVPPRPAANAEGVVNEKSGDAATATPKAESDVAAVAATKGEVGPNPEPAEVAPDDNRDRTILGETMTGYVRRITVNQIEPYPGFNRQFVGARDFLRPDVAETMQAVRGRVLHAARLPGIAGLVFSDTAAAGYADPASKGASEYLSSRGDTTVFGYTPELRLAFLRKEGYDPIDLDRGASYIGGVQITLPFFPDVSANYIKLPSGDYGVDPKGGAPLKRWAAFRYELNAALLAELYQAVRTDNPGLPLVIRERGSGAYWSSWEQGDKLPIHTYEYAGENAPQKTVFQTAKDGAKTALLNVSFDPTPFTYPGQPVDPVKPDSPQAFSRFVSSYQGYMKGSWNGIVFDLTAVPVAKALPLFVAGIAPPGTPVKAPVRKPPPPGAAAVMRGAAGSANKP